MTGRTLLSTMTCFAFSILAITSILPTHASQRPTGRALDLPVRRTCQPVNDTKAPECVLFYGAEFEADTFVWVLDHSGSMGMGDRMRILKSELTAALSQLSHQAEFGLVAFATGMTEFKPRIASGHRDKTAAIRWVNALSSAGATCLAPAVVRGLEIVTTSDRRNRRIIVCSDGIPHCGEGAAAEEYPATCLADIKAANVQDVRIDTVAIDPAATNFLIKLAAMNHGSFTIAD